ncbi:protein [Escherichia coli]|uniref:Protein n=1 Tax=Escherichia coli TaxID=562 RepID=A0A376S8M7_ECOLX|nr:protein [Escherichia coli]
MFSTNLIQSNYGDLNIKSLAFDSFKERLESTWRHSLSYINGHVTAMK